MHIAKEGRPYSNFLNLYLFFVLLLCILIHIHIERSFFVFIFRNWIFRLHCLGVSSLLFDELARSARVLLALCTFCLYIVIIRMPMSFLRVHLCLHKYFCVHHVSKYACLQVHIFDLQHSNAAQPRCGLAMCLIKQKLLPGSHQVSSCHHTYTFSSACMLKNAIVIP